MKFSDREKELFSILKRRAGKMISFDIIFNQIAAKYKNPPKHLRKSVVFSMRKLRDKLSHYEIELARVSPVGRGYKAVYMITRNAAKFKLDQQKVKNGK